MAINVGPPVLTINQGSTFMVTDLNGEIAAESEHGVFAGDTRFVSHFALLANGEPWRRLTSSPTAYYAARIHLTNALIATEDGDIPESTLELVVSRSAGEGIHEDLDVTNYGMKPVRLNLELAIRSDFAHLFDVKAHRFVPRGRIETVWDQESAELRVSYDNRDFHRRLIYRSENSNSRPRYANGRVTFEIELAPGASWHTCCHYILEEQDRVRAPQHACNGTSVEGASDAPDLDQLQREWQACATKLTSANDDISRLYRQSVEDMGGLRLYEHDFAPDMWLPAAGVPWFLTIFGRDSLIVSLQNMLVHAGFARGALKKLAEFQATAIDDYRDAEPGKIPHEIRFGELAHFGKVPHTPYYGTADATALYLITLHEAWKWLGDDGLLREYRDVAERCLEWIDHHGDLDGDGFQEYRTRSTLGYENLGWKDADDAVVYPDGSQVRQPKALCELQGYVFDAWVRMAEVFDTLGEPHRAAALRGRAAGLQERFEEHFWCEDAGFYAFALDPDKRPVPTITSNPGHLLWSGIVRRDRAARVAERLMQPDMRSGWGIRTLSAKNPAFNPLSYQRGSVWPHDNGIIALGFKRYGFAQEAAQIARDISEVASCFVSYRLPELYAGTERAPGTFPVQYLGANVPQAWAAGSVFHLLQAMLGIRADAPHGRLYVDPQLPAWLPDVALHGIAVADASVDLRFWREGERTRWDASVRRGAIQVAEQPWEPGIPLFTAR
ncbi:MAG: amylo-alpha-1,6-glucosidase [Chloroflexi bacterium]|nr:amylo-alpha-1,6-glucosidase [Chloroflexota bacterium]